MVTFELFWQLFQ